MIITGIDPSPTIHAWAVVSGTADNPKLVLSGRDYYTALAPNGPLFEYSGDYRHSDKFICEMVACYGMAAGASLFDTCVAIGELKRFVESNGQEMTRVTRTEVKLRICKRSSANDSNIRQAIIDRFGGPSSIKKGGPLYGVAKDTWAAIAVALAGLDHETKYYIPAHQRVKEAK